MSDDTSSRPDDAFRPVDGVRRLSQYEVPRPGPPAEVRLDGNLGLRTSEYAEIDDTCVEPGSIRPYPDDSPLVGAICDAFDLPEERVLVTGGANGAIMRACGIALNPDRSMVVPEPTFSLIPRFGVANGADVRCTTWLEGDYPVDGVLDLADDDTGLIAAVTPNNPTGLLASRGALEAVADRVPSALLLLDHAYVDYADQDLTSMAVRRDDVVVTRTLSKAWGMAGLRVGFAVAAPDIVRALDSVGNTYPNAGPALELARRRLRGGRDAVDAHVRRVRRHRGELRDLLGELGVPTTDSRANYVYAVFDDDEWVCRALAARNLAVRIYDGDGGREGALRITVPDERATMDHLERALRTIAEPEALVVELGDVAGRSASEPSAAVADRLERFGDVAGDRPLAALVGCGEAGVSPEPEALERSGAVDAAVEGEPTQSGRTDALERLAERLDVDRAWLVVGRPETARAARRSDSPAVLPLGAPDSDSGDDPGALVQAGCAKVLDDTDELRRRWMATETTR
ncbi:MAG: histidinol-phosphate transaminase [Bradymonadaceae bacterium]